MLETEYIKPLKRKLISNNIKLGTFDIETVVKKGEHKAYLFSFYDGKEHFSFFSNNASELFESILKRKYRNYTFYAHNLSRFDIVFIFRDLAELKKTRL